MPDFKFCAAVRDNEGMLSEPVYMETITAPDAIGAVAQAKSMDLDMVQLRANALYLLDATGHVVWSLRTADVPNLRI